MTVPRRLVAGAIAAMLCVACGDDVDPVSSESLANASYLSQATPDGRITLIGGAFEFPAGSPVERVEMVDFAIGDFDGDDDADAAVVLVETSGRSRLYRLHAMVGDGRNVEDVASRLVGDRIGIRAVRIEDGLVELDMLVRGARNNPESQPTIPITNRFALTGRGLLPVDPPVVVEGGPRALQGGDTATLTSHEWLLDRIETGDRSMRTDSLETRPSLRFVRELGDGTGGTGRLYGTAGCNRIFGNYDRRADGSFRILALAATRRACRGAGADLETRIISSLRATQRLSIDGDALQIEFDGGTMHFRAGGELAPPEPLPTAPPEGSDGELTESGRRS